MSLEYQKETPLDSGENPPHETVGQNGIAITPYYSIILITSIVAVSLSQIGTDPTTFDVAAKTSIDLAGFDKVLFAQGQYWRILTGVALHGGIMHLLFNSYALFVLGRLVEFLSNRAHLAIVFLLSAVGGGLLSFVFSPYETSVGASGGILGFLGYLTVYGYKRRKLLSSSFLKNMLFNIGFIGVIGVFVLPRIDNLGHLGGLLAGALYGFVQISSDVYKDPREVGKVTEYVGRGALGVFMLATFLSILLILKVIEL